MEPVTAVKRLDLMRYLGSWYEVARYPNRFEKKCDRNVMAHYAATDRPGWITVRNECRRKDGTVSVAKGYGKLDSSSGEGKLKVSFFRPFWARYWVIALDAEYRWSLVGEPQRKYLWILSRTPGLQAAALETIEGHATRQGFEWAQLIWTPKS